MSGIANRLSFHASGRNLFLAFFPVFFTPLSPWNGNLAAENMVIENISWEWVLVGMTTVNGLSLCGVRVVARKIDDGSLRSGSSLAPVVSHQYGDWTPEAWQWNGGVGAMVGRVTCHRLLGQMMQWIFWETLLPFYAVYGMWFLGVPGRVSSKA